MTYTPKDWYWIVGGDASQVFSSARGVLVPVSDAQFVAWSAQDGGNSPTKIDTLANLGGVLAARGIRPTDAGVLAGYQQTAAAAMDTALLRIMLNHENRIRALEAKAPITPAQFLAAISTLL